MSGQAGPTDRETPGCSRGLSCTRPLGCGSWALLGPGSCAAAAATGWAGGSAAAGPAAATRSAAAAVPACSSGGGVAAAHGNHQTTFDCWTRAGGRHRKPTLAGPDSRLACCRERHSPMAAWGGRTLVLQQSGRACKPPTEGGARQTARAFCFCLLTQAGWLVIAPRLQSHAKCRPDGPACLHHLFV